MTEPGAGKLFEPAAPSLRGNATLCEDIGDRRDEAGQIVGDEIDMGVAVMAFGLPGLMDDFTSARWYDQHGAHADRLWHP